MNAMVLTKIGSLAENKTPLHLVDMPMPRPKVHEVVIKVSVCGACHTELDEIEGRITPITLPIIPGHQVVGTIVETAKGSKKFKIGDRVGVAWIFSACGRCEYCVQGLENLCDEFLATGKDVHGGYAEFMTAHENYIYPIPDFFTDIEAAPMLCAGAIGYRSMQLGDIRNGENLGLTGFGASAHLMLKLVTYRFPKTKVYVFARSKKERRFAIELGAVWSGDSTDRSPEKLHCIIDTTPVWKPIVEALANLKKGGRLVINAIRKEEIDKEYLLHLSYNEHLWMEKDIKTVANVTGHDVRNFIKLAAEAAIRPEAKIYPLAEANVALLELKEGHIRGAKVLTMS
jgi:propanol-preferring alcohol dehydrogenase